MGEKFDTSMIGNPVPGGNSSAKNDSSKKNKDEQNIFSVTNNGNFSFLYDQKIAGCIKDIKSDNLYVTKLSNYNNYYYRSGYNYNSEATPTSGKSTAVNCYDSNKSFAARLSASDKAQYGNAQHNYEKLNNGTVIANCVGWCNGRLWEIWGRALSTGYIKWDSTQNSFVITSNNAKIAGSFNYPYYPPNYSAYQWWDTWPGNSVECGWYKSQTPQVGAVICWGNGTNGDQRPGHVAIVEEIHNAGQPDEELVISHSAYTPHGTMWLVNINTVKKSTNYRWYSECTLRGFLISPVCQLASTNGKIMSNLVTNPAREPSEEELERNRLFREQSSGKTVEKDLPQGAKVRVVRLGYKRPEGVNITSTNIASDRVSDIGIIGYIWTKDLTKQYPYGICRESDPSHSITGYYDWTGIEMISSDLLTEETVKIRWDEEEDSPIPRPDSINVTLKIYGLTNKGTKTLDERDLLLTASNNWSITAMGLPKYTKADTLTKFEFVIESLPTSYELERTVTLNHVTSLTIKYLGPTPKWEVK